MVTEQREKGTWLVYICSSTQSTATRKRLTPEPNTGTDSVTLQISKSLDLDFHCQLVFADVLG